jgi:hypothetical protein
MADEKPTLHIDNDWKRQAQEEKKRLAEQEAAKAQEAALKSAPSASSVGLGPAAPGAVAGREGARANANPAASFGSLVQSVLTQVLFYLGDLSARGGEPAVNLDLAKHHIDTLGVLEEKTKGNLADDEKKLLDTALYETRMRYVNVASQYL